MPMTQGRVGLENRTKNFSLLALISFVFGCSFMISRRAVVSAMSTATTSATPTSRIGNKPRLVLHWFRNDLRVHDNPALVHSSKAGDVCLPVFFFDAALYGDSARTPFGSLKWGPKRAKFLLESVADLRDQLQAIGSELVVAHGALDAEFDRLVNALHQDYQISVVCQEEPLKEERDALQRVQVALKKYQPQSRVITVWGSTMYELSDLPFSADLANMPDVFTPFRVQVEKGCKIPRPLPAPRNKLVPLPKDSSHRHSLEASLSFLPDLQGLGYTEEQIAEAQSSDPRGVMAFVGGETRALARVKEYIWDLNLLKEYFDTRNGMLGPNYSSKFSPWLSVGCLSPRHVAQQCAKYEEQIIKNKSTYWLVFELLWRDFCKFFCAKHGDKVFYPGGTIGKRSKKWSTYESNFAAWKEGRTGYPLVDANMRELMATGWMSNRGRQNVCSFLAIDMNHDWRYGADWFESQLLDYDVYSNWFNWCAGAGMTGGRLNRFNIVKQGKDYDQHGEYVRHWIPELGNVPNDLVHEPWKMTQFQQMQYDVRLGVDYPNPVIPPFQPKPYDKKGGEGRSSSGGGGGSKPSRQRPPNRGGGNRHQKYEMKSLKEGRFDFK